MKSKRFIWTVVIIIGVLMFCGISAAVAVVVYQFNDSPAAGFGDAIAIIPVEGVITTGYPPTDIFGDTGDGAYSGYIVEKLKEVDEDSQVKAVILFVDSPGGGVLASDEIYAQVAAMSKPTLISMGALAASGGYYISAPADEIWAHRHTLTGSIGVIIQFFDFSGFMEAYGINLNVVKSGANKDTGGFHRSMTAEEQKIWQTLIDETFDVFVNIIAEGRDLKKGTIREFADGRIYSAQQALDLGLIDQLGDLDDVIDRAVELGGIEDEEPRIIDYRNTSNSPFSFSSLFHRPSPVEELSDALNLQRPPMLMYLYTGP